MQTLKPTITFLHDTRRTKKEDLYPVKLTVYYDGDKKRYKTGIDLSIADWNRLWLSNLRDDLLKAKRRKILTFKEKVENIAENLNPFCFADLESFLFEDKRIRKSSMVADLFEDYIKLLEKEDRIGTAMSYRTTINSIKSFKGNIRISEINSNYLRDYERHLMVEGKSPSTVGIYMRQLRRICNYSIESGLLSATKYPFKGYAIPNSRNIKKALSAEQLKKILNYTTDDVEKRRAVDFWIFSYLSNGINMTDICMLKKENVQGDFFFFFRAKTINTKKRDLRPIKVPLVMRSIAIIEKWKNTSNASHFLFPILEPGLTAKQMKFKVQDFIKKVNQQMKKVALELEIPFNVGTYVARHTHSTILKRKGISTEIIKENLGHASILTTESYLDDFTDDLKLDIAKLLTDF